MAGIDSRSVITPLKGANYATWKIQCRMALMKDGVWSIVDGSEVEPTVGDADVAKYASRRDRAPAIIVLAVDTRLLYLLGNPQNPTEVWRLLEEQFQKKTWANKLDLRRGLFACQLRSNGDVQDHIKAMPEIFEELSVIGSPVDDEDKVVHLLASLPSEFAMLVTALEAHSEVPQWKVVMERILNEERKQKDDQTDLKKGLSVAKSFGSGSRKSSIKCYHCGMSGHFKRQCRKVEKNDRFNHQTAGGKGGRALPPEHKNFGLIQVASVMRGKNEGWIIDSGATSHMCKDVNAFVDLVKLKKPVCVTLGDGGSLEATSVGNVPIISEVRGETRNCTLYDVLYVPGLAYNLLSVSKSADRGVRTIFDTDSCQIESADGYVLAIAIKVDSLYHLMIQSKCDGCSLCQSY
jgi:Zinc knuckle.